MRNPEILYTFSARFGQLGCPRLRRPQPRRDWRLHRHRDKYSTIETDSDSDEEDKNMHVMDYEKQYSFEEGEESGENEGMQEGYDCMFVEPGPGNDHRCFICHLAVSISSELLW